MSETTSALPASVAPVVDSSTRTAERALGVARAPVAAVPDLAPAAFVPATRLRRTRRWLVGLDATALAAAVGMAVLAGESGRTAAAWTGPLVFAGALLLLNAVSRDYVADGTRAFLDDLPGVLGRALVAFALGTVASLYARVPVQLDVVATFLTVALAGRCAGFALARRRLRRGGEDLLRPTVVIGAGPVARRLATAMQERPELGRQPLGFLEDDRTPELGEHDLPMLGDVAALPTLLECSPQLDAIVADTAVDDDDMIDVIRRCDRVVGEIYVVPRLAEVYAVDGESIAGVPLTRLARRSHRSPLWRLKRVVDVAVAVVGLVLVLPLMALLALLVLLEGGRGVLFRQERVGIDGRCFEILKLRSLRPAAPREGDERWSIQGDPRLGPVGKTLRTLSLDELPQLWNVAKGDMSLVGPRPERPYFVSEFSSRYPHYHARHRVPAGLTGASQISGLRGDTDISERAHCDNGYITSWSLWGDVKIVIRTAGKFVTRVGG